jgi:integration host factor subunit beta
VQADGQHQQRLWRISGPYRARRDTLKLVIDAASPMLWTKPMRLIGGKTAPAATSGRGRFHRWFRGGAILKSDLVGRMAERNPRLGAPDFEKIVDAIFEKVSDALGQSRGDRDFGSFATKLRLARTARNPKSGAIAAIGEKRVPSKSKDG